MCRFKPKEVEVERAWVYAKSAEMQILTAASGGATAAESRHRTLNDPLGSPTRMVSRLALG